MEDSDNFFRRATALGFQVGLADNAMFHFGLDFCAQTIRGRVSPDCARTAYQSFDQGRYLAREQEWPGLPKSATVQISKLRQFAEVGKEIGADGYMLLAKLPLLIGDPTKHQGIYVVATGICRRMLSRGKPLSEQDVRNLYP